MHVLFFMNRLLFLLTCFLKKKEQSSDELFFFLWLTVLSFPVLSFPTYQNHFVLLNMTKHQAVTPIKEPCTSASQRVDMHVQQWHAKARTAEHAWINTAYYIFKSIQLTTYCWLGTEMASPVVTKRVGGAQTFIDESLFLFCSLFSLSNTHACTHTYTHIQWITHQLEALGGRGCLGNDGEGTLVICVEHIFIWAETERHRNPRRRREVICPDSSFTLLRCMQTHIHTHTNTHIHSHEKNAHAWTQ